MRPNESKTYFKMYKAGKQWLVAGMTLLGVGLVMGMSTAVKADTVAETTDTTAVQTVKPATSATGTKSTDTVAAGATSQTTVNVQSATSSSANSASASTSGDVQAKSATNSSSANSVQSTASAASQANSHSASTDSAASSVITKTTSTASTDNSENKSVSSKANNSDLTSAPEKSVDSQANSQMNSTEKAISAASNVKTTDLGTSGDAKTLAIVKSAATQDFKATGQPQKIVRYAADKVISFNDKGFHYAVNDDGKTVTVYSWDGFSGSDIDYDYGKDGKPFVIRSTATDQNGKVYTVTDIAKQAFNYWGGGTSIVGELIIPDTIISIGGGAFTGRQITKVKMSKNVKSIGGAAFSEAMDRANNYSIGDLDLSNVTDIGDFAFQNAGVTSLKLGNSIRTIGSDAFSDNLNFDGNLNIPDGILLIDKNAFKNTPINNLKIGQSIQTINDYAFWNEKPSLTPQLTDLELPNLTHLGAHSFENVSTIRNLKFGKDLTVIPEYAFHNSLNITKLSLPANLLSIGNYAFQGDQISSVVFPNSVENIGTAAFDSNQIVSDLILPEKITDISAHAFSNNKIKSLNFKGNIQTIKTSAFENNLISGVLNLPPKTLYGIGPNAFANNLITAVSLPKGLFAVDVNAFANNLITSVSISEGVNYIEASSFENNRIENLALPETINSIGTNAFANNFLKTVAIPNAVQIIMPGAFAHNYLTAIKLPKSIQYVGKGAFEDNRISQVSAPTGVIYFDVEMNGQTPILTPAPVFQNQTVQKVFHADVDTLPLKFEVLGMRVFDLNQTGVTTDDHLEITNLQADGQSTGISYDPEKQIFIIKPGVKTFTFKFKDTTNSVAGFSGNFTGIIDYTGIHLNAATDGTADTVDLNVGDSYKPLDSVHNLTTVKNEIFQPTSKDVISNETPFPENNDIYAIKPEIKVVDSNVNTAIPGKYEVILTTNGPIKATDTNDVYRVIAHVNVRQKYTWQFIDGKTHQVINPVDVDSGQALMTSIDYPDTEYEVKLPPVIRVGATLYYLHQNQLSDTLQWTKPNGSYVYVTDSASITAKSTPTTIAQNGNVDLATLIDQVTKINGLSMTKAEIAAALTGNNATITVVKQPDTSKAGRQEITFVYQYANQHSLTATAVILVVTSPKIAVTGTTVVNMNTPYSPADTFISATDEYGQSLSLSSLTVTNQVNLGKAGTYLVKYQYHDVSQIATVIVRDAAAMEVTPNITIRQGKNFDPLSAITLITKPNGVAMTRAELEAALKSGLLTIEGLVNTQVPGQYRLIYTYDDPIIRASLITVEKTATTTDEPDDLVKPTVDPDSSGDINPVSPQPDIVEANVTSQADQLDATPVSADSQTSQASSVSTKQTSKGIAGHEKQPAVLKSRLSLKQPKGAVVVKVSQAKTDSQKLPQTDEKQPTNNLSLIGLLLLAGSTLLATVRRREN